ncbi:lytic transglycosylase domain-containing protein [Microvirga arabica]|uniref:lytic transglycosylase domain-containing protein n=1 Tax=Microvirga arabica TaxID=1128671 RepID=UPI0035E42B47
MPQAYTSGRKAHLATIRREAEQVGLPPDVADAVAQVESSYNPGSVGGVGEVGLMQIRPTTAAMLGYRGTLAGLFEPETNIRYGVAYLGRAWQLADGNLCRALMKYRAGHGEERMTPLSVEYCRRVRTHLAAVGSSIGAGGDAVSVSPTASSTFIASSASKTAPKAVADKEAESDTASAVRQAKSTSAKTMRVRPPQRPITGFRIAAVRRMKVASAETRSLTIVQAKAKRKAKIQQMWAAHDARLQAISARLKPESLRISTGI